MRDRDHSSVRSTPAAPRLSVAVALLASVLAACGARPSAPPSDGEPLETGATLGMRHIALRDGRLCAVTRDRRAWCMGKNGVGQLGDGTSVDRDRPVLVAGLEDVDEVVLGRAHGCARRLTGDVACWGDNAAGQLGDGSRRFRLEPVHVTGVADATQLTASDEHTLALRGDGSVLCWGSPCADAEEDVDDVPGRDRSVTEYFVEMFSHGLECVGPVRSRCALVPRALSKAAGFDQISTAFQHSCGVRGAGEVACVGINSQQQLGRDRPYFAAVPAGVPGVADVLQVTTLERQSCALLRSGEVMCWGPDAGVSRSDDEPPEARALQVTTFDGATALAQGPRTLCAVTRDGRILCARAEFALLHDAAESGPLEPVEYLGVHDAVGVAVDEDVLCILRESGAVLCDGVLPGRAAGSGADDWVAEPIPLPPLAGSQMVAAGRRNSCAVGADGRVACWGTSVPRTLGAPLEPVPVPELTGVVEVAVGARHACGRQESGEVWCWSLDRTDDGTALGSGSARPSLEPVRVAGIADARQVSVLNRHGCALRDNGQVLCWGLNHDGQLGDGSTEDRLAPVAVAGLDGARRIAVGGFHSCALLASGEARCWGDNSVGQLGDGTESDRSRPVSVLGLDDAVEIGAGYSFTCARRAGGEVLCWGRITWGSPRAGGVDSSRPIPLSDAPAARSIAVGGAMLCIRTAEGEARCWEPEEDVIFGGPIRPVSRSRTPSTTVLPDGAEALFPGWYHACARFDSGEVRCWGLRLHLGGPSRAGVWSIEPP